MHLALTSKQIIGVPAWCSKPQDLETSKSVVKASTPSSSRMTRRSLTRSANTCFVSVKVDTTLAQYRYLLAIDWLSNDYSNIQYVEDYENLIHVTPPITSIHLKRFGCTALPYDVPKAWKDTPSTPDVGQMIQISLNISQQESHLQREERKSRVIKVLMKIIASRDQKLATQARPFHVALNAKFCFSSMKGRIRTMVFTNKDVEANTMS